MRYLSLFTGIGAFEKALKRLGIEYELVGFSEIDKYAIKSYCAVHDVNEELNLGDISKIDLDSLPENIDLITHGSPCQDFSIAGKLAGGDKGSGTRSSLMWCTVDIVERAKPKYVVWENVKNLLSAKNRHNFDSYLEVMDKLGYNSYYEVLNSKYFGIPQNRERVFTVSIRKDIDTGYIFPPKHAISTKLKDLLEEKVDEKYYLSDKLLAGLIANTERQKEKGNGFAFETTDGNSVAKTVTTRVGACRSGDNYIEVIGKLDIKGHDCVKRVYSGEGLAPTLTDMQGGNRQPKVAVAMRGRYNESGNVEQQVEISDREIANSITTVQKDSMVGEYLKIKEATKQGYKKAYEGDGVNLSGRMKWQRGNVQKDMCQTLVTKGSERGVVVADDEDLEEYDGFNLRNGEYADLGCGLRIRKLTPLECWRLMGFDDEDFYKAKAVPTSDTQLYKQAGNSIVVNVLEAIFYSLFKRKGE